MKLVYVTGPFQGANPSQTELNVRRAEEIGLEVAEAGAVPAVPHTMYKFYGIFGQAFWLQCVVTLLARCDAIVLFGPWEADSCAYIQAKEAERLSLDRFTDKNFDALRTWARR